MSSNNHKQYSPDDFNIDGSMVESTDNPEAKVCFICGTHTTLIINIHEPRCGPNMINVISEKFKMRPLNDDKFLCYTCNNWLVNWYTMQKKSGNDSNHEDAQQTTSSTVSTATAESAHEQTATIQTSDESNELVIISDEEDDENVDINNVIRTLRQRLKKYLYYPKREKCNDLDKWQAHPQATLIELNATANIAANCERCGKLLRRHSQRRNQRCCRSCRSLMRRFGKCSNQMKVHTNHLKRAQYQHKAHISSPLKRHQSVHASDHVRIFQKLQQLGTSIYYESECRGQEQRRTHHHMISIPREMDTNAQKREANAWKRQINDSNEILMTFNTVVTEVFPIDELYNKYYDQQHDQLTNTSNNINIQEILRNVPKSLTITIA